MDVKRAISRAIVVSTLIATPRVARAQVHSPPEPEAASTSDWYGWQVIAIDALVLTYTSGTILLEKRPTEIVILGPVFGVFGAPFIHAIHQRPLVALADVGLRMLVPTASGMTGALIGARHTGSEDEGVTNTQWGGLIGYGLGLAAVSAFDAAVLSYGRILPNAPIQHDAEGGEISLTPAVEVTASRQWVGVAGRF